MTYTREKQIEIANTILQQMGGYGKLKAMIGIYNLLAIDDGLRFDFKGSKKVNRVTIELTPDDLYNVSFYKIPGFPKKVHNIDKYFEKLDQCNIPITKFDGIYCDQLIDIFEATTGLYLHL